MELTNMKPHRMPLVPLLAVGLLAMACSPRPSGNALTTPTPNVSVSVAVSPAKLATVTQSLGATGNVVALSSVDVVPRQAGRIEKLPVDLGSKVTAGDVIAQLDHSAQDLNLENAQAQLLATQAKVATIKAGPRPENVQQAQLTVSSAQARLQAMLNGPQAATITQARASVDAAQQKLAAVQAQGSVNSIAQAQANLDAAQARLQALQNGPSPTDIAPLQLAVSQAKDALYSAQISRDATCGHDKGASCQAANASVDAAQTAVDQANANLKAKVAPPSQTDLQQAKAAVNQAQAALNAAKQPYTAQDLKQAQDAVTQAEASLALAKQPYTAQDLEQQKNAVASAQQALSLAQHPYTDQDLQTAEAGVAQAQVGVDQARQAVTDTTVTAPVAGIITQKQASEGGLASAAAPIVSISSALVKVQVPIEESQVPNLKLGDVAAIGGAVLGSATMTGKVTNVAPSGDTKSRTFTADVTPAQAGDLRPGMFVQVTIALQEHQNVTSVSTSAIVANANGTFVFVVENGIAHEIPVTTGLANPTLTEITEGVSLGQSVVVQGQQRLNDGDRVTVTTVPVG
jgi:RND family efflux transporter MFP subunit